MSYKLQRGERARAGGTRDGWGTPIELAAHTYLSMKQAVEMMIMSRERQAMYWNGRDRGKSRYPISQGNSIDCRALNHNHAVARRDNPVNKLTARTSRLELIILQSCNWPEEFV